MNNKYKFLTLFILAVFIFVFQFHKNTITVPPPLYKGSQNEMIIFSQTMKDNDKDTLFFTTMDKEKSSSLFDLSETKKLSLKSYLKNFQYVFREYNSNRLETLFDGTYSINRFGYSTNVSKNPLQFLSLLSSLILHGNLDDNKSFEELISTLEHRHLSLTCGRLSLFAKDILEKLSVESRIVTTLTLDNWNSYDNGHTLLEVYIKEHNKWVLVDLDAKTVFRNRLNGQLINALDLSKINFEEIELVALNDASRYDYSGFEQYQILLDYVSTNPREWYQRVFQSVGILDTETNNYIFIDNLVHSNFKNKIEGYSSSYKVVDGQHFVDLFYGE